MTAIQQVSFDGASLEETQSDTLGSNPSLAITGPGSNGPKRAETFSGFDTKLKPDNINRASSMRAPERPGVGFPSRQVPAAGSPKVKHKRRGSGGVLPFLTKSNSKEDKEQAVTTGRLQGGPSRPIQTDRNELSLLGPTMWMTSWTVFQPRTCGLPMNPNSLKFLQVDVTGCPSIIFAN